MACKIVPDLRGPCSPANGAQPVRVPGHCPAFACWSPGVIGSRPLQGSAILGAQISTQLSWQEVAGMSSCATGIRQAKEKE